MKASRTFRAAVVGIAVLLALVASNVIRGSAQTPPAPSQSQAAPGYLSPLDFARAYEFQKLWDLGYKGERQTVAVITFGAYDPNDITAFDTHYGIAGAPTPEPIPVNGGTRLGDDEAWDGETLLDVEMIRAVAPMAQILVYEASNETTTDTVMSRIRTDGQATIVSMSFGGCDVPEHLDRDVRAAQDEEFMKAKAAGITVLASSGDTGALTCERNGDHTDMRPTGSWPADSRYVIAVGGTRLSRSKDGSYLEEAGWIDPLSGLATGGGLNPLDLIPDWQVGPGVQNAGSNGNRQFPDVAGPADPADAGSDLGEVTLDPQTSQPKVSGGGNGTSQASPFWAGVLALIQEYAQDQGIPSLGTQVAEMLYQLAATPQRLPPFHDVIEGGNRLNACTPGWDYATGLGTPIVFNLAQDVVDYLRLHPPAEG